MLEIFFLILFFIIKTSFHLVCLYYKLQKEEFQNAIASFCYNFYKESGASTRYDYGTAGLGVNEGQSENYAVYSWKNQSRTDRFEKAH